VGLIGEGKAGPRYRDRGREGETHGDTEKYREMQRDAETQGHIARERYNNIITN
jgi:hypothetical protein